MTLSQYIRTKGYKLTVTRLAEITLYSRDGLHKMYNRAPSTIDDLLNRYNEQLKEFKR